MSVSENFVPQSENLEPLESAINELEGVSVRSTLLKNKVISSVDSLIQKLNDDNSSTHSAVIRRLEKFLSGYSDIVGEYTLDEKKTQLEQLRDQNTRLKQVLETRKAYNAEAERVNGEYEESIGDLMALTLQKKTKLDNERFHTIREINSQLMGLKEAEWIAYEELVKSEEIVFKLVRAITDLYDVLGFDLGNEETNGQMMYLVKFYKDRLAGKKDSYKLRTPGLTEHLFTVGM